MNGDTSLHNNVQKFGNKAPPYSWLITLEKFAYWHLMAAASFYMAVPSMLSFNELTY